ncbi:MAG: polysaccharide pyruvyl transferase family protein [Candidatus Aminicenantes bacterium]|nr:polysaccharide pyruvyl transferase family protein [Candidatus Aminicenantes bacterium]
MRVLLINYSGDQFNPGCRASSSGLITMLRAAGTSHIDTMPLGFTPEAMSFPLSADEDGLQLPSRQNPRAKKTVRDFFHFMLKIKRLSTRFAAHFRSMRLPPWAQVVHPSNSFVVNLEADRWTKAIDEIMEREADGFHDLRLADRVIVNGEGTFHHNQRTALAALALARIAEILGKEVHIINATIQAMHPDVLRLVLGSAGRVVVREVRSKQYLESLGIHCLVGADCAFAAPYRVTQPMLRLPDEVAPDSPCLVSGGCGLRSSSVLAIVNALRRAGFSPFYFWIGDGDAISIGDCQAAGIPVVMWNEVPWPVLPEYLKQVKLVVSGRHHMIIFALLAHIPFVPLASNTWKIEGLCELFGWPVPVLPGEHGFARALSSLPELQTEMKAAFERVDKTALELALRNMAEIPIEES